MAANRLMLGVTVLMAFGIPSQLPAQQAGQQAEPMRAAPQTRTVRPVLRGREYAVSSMKAQATAAAVEILDAGGNAFDAAVAGQAVLALVDPASNGIGADAVLLVYDAAEKEVFSINAEGMAPQLATIDWYEQHNNGELPRSDGLLAASTPGVVDAWYILLDRWGDDDVRAGAAAGDRRRGRGVPRQRGPEPDHRRLIEDQEVRHHHEGLRSRRARARTG